MFKLNIKYLSILSIFIIVVIVFMFIFIDHNKNNTNSNVLVKFNDSDIITIDSKLTISDTLGKTLTNDTVENGVFGFLDFSVSNKTNRKVRYEINLIKQSVIGHVIKDNYIKLYLTDYNDNLYKNFSFNSLVPNYNQLSNSKRTSSNNKVLYTDELNSLEVKYYRLRVWLSDSYVVSSEKESFSFDVDVNVF